MSVDSITAQSTYFLRYKFEPEEPAHKLHRQDESSSLEPDLSTAPRFDVSNSREAPAWQTTA